MITKTKGDILAERIANELRKIQPATDLRASLWELIDEYRDTEVDPYAELKAAFKAGKTIQVCDSRREIWVDEENPCFDAPVSRYRVKPAPKLVPLGPEDVPPGSVIRYIHRIHGYEWLALRGLPVDGSGVELANGALLSFELIKEKCEISRDNGKTWERCEKEAK